MLIKSEHTFLCALGQMPSRYIEISYFRPAWVSFEILGGAFRNRCEDHYQRGINISTPHAAREWLRVKSLNFEQNVTPLL
jgi:hypothetical protein